MIRLPSVEERRRLELPKPFRTLSLSGRVPASSRDDLSEFLEEEAGIEPATPFGATAFRAVRHAICLLFRGGREGSCTPKPGFPDYSDSSGADLLMCQPFQVVPAGRVALPSSAYETDVLLLNYTGMNLGAAPRNRTGICELQARGPALERERRVLHLGRPNPHRPGLVAGLSYFWSQRRVLPPHFCFTEAVSCCWTTLAWWARQESHLRLLDVTEPVCCYPTRPGRLVGPTGLAPAYSCTPNRRDATFPSARRSLAGQPLATHPGLRRALASSVARVT